MVQPQQSYKELESRNGPSELLCVTGARLLHPCHPQWSKPRAVCHTKATTTERDRLLSKGLLLRRSSPPGLRSTPGALFQMVHDSQPQSPRYPHCDSPPASDRVPVVFPATDSSSTMGAWPETGCSHGSLTLCTALCGSGPPQGCRCSSTTSFLYGHQLVGPYLHPPFSSLCPRTILLLTVMGQAPRGQALRLAHRSALGGMVSSRSRRTEQREDVTPMELHRRWGGAGK